MERLGERVKKRRELLGIGQRQVAQQIDASISMLSQIENGRAFPSILTLKKIAEALHTTVGDLIGEQENLSINPVVRSGEGKFVKKNSNGTAKYLLSHHDPGKQMEIYKLVFSSGGDTSDILFRHYGQSYCYILKGKLNIMIGHRKYTLSVGDSLYFMSNIDHIVTNSEKNNAECIWVVTPPSM